MPDRFDSPTGYLRRHHITVVSFFYVNKNLWLKLLLLLRRPHLSSLHKTLRIQWLRSLKQKLVYKKELTNGYAFKFPGTASVPDELAEFIKAERKCCGFFTFGFSEGLHHFGTWTLTSMETIRSIPIFILLGLCEIGGS